MPRTFCWAVAGFLLLAGPAWAAVDGAKCTVMTATAEPPKELAEPIRALLSDRSVQLLDGEGKLIGEFWFRKELRVKATAEELKKGIGYRKLEESTVLGAVRLDQAWTSFRKQIIKPGLYTLRIGFQPMDGDHMGTAPYNEFCLLSPAAADKSPALLEGKQLHELSAKTLPGTTHPVVMLLFPNAKTEDAPKLLDKQNGIWVLSWKEDVASAGQKGVLGLGLTLFGVTTAE